MHPDNLVKLRLLMCISFILFFSWVILCLDLRANFQNTASIDPLAMLNTLYPSFWILLAAFGVLCVAAFLLCDSAKWLHAILLSQLSLILFYTPFFLSGFSWSPDSLWHGGVASYMPSILSGTEPPLSHYAQSYPLSFLTTYVAELVSGLDVFSLTLYVYPIVCIISITVLAYIFASRLLSPRIAFLSLLLTLPALHFIEPHVSPFSTGTILVLVSMVLTTFRGVISRVLLLLAILALVLAHPISPVTLGIFLFAVVVLNAVSKKQSSQHRVAEPLPRISVSYSVLLFLGVLWTAWSIYWAASIYTSVRTAILNVVSLNFLTRFEYATSWTLSGGFIYREINTLSLVIYSIFLSFVVCLFLWSIGKRVVLERFIRRKATISKGQITRPYLDYGISVSAFASIAYAGYSYVLFQATGQRFMLGRGLIFFILFASMCMSWFFFRQNSINPNLKNLIAIGLVLFLLVSFPIVSYSKEAYNTYTPSSGYGLSFIISHIDVANESISSSFDQQLAAYANLSKGLLISHYPPRALNETGPDFIVLRTGSFFVSAMRYYLSFENNSYTQLQDSLIEDPWYDSIYSSPTFKIYSLKKG